MPEENAEAVRRIYAASAREESASAFIADGSVECEKPDGCDGGRRASRYGRKSFAIVRGADGDFETELERILDAGDETVVLARYTASGTVSGVPVGGEHGYVWTVRDGLAVRFQWFQSHREALEAAGLSE